VSAFERSRGALCGEGVPLEALADRFGTPLYVYSRAALIEAYDAYDQAFAAVPHRICYALKANSSGALLRILAARGAGADIVSGGELRAALRAGFPPERLVFSGVGKSAEEIRLGLEAGIGAFNVESEAEIRLIDAAARAASLRARVALRVNPDIDPGSHPYVSTGLSESKFGVPIGAARGILGRARGLGGIEIAGVHSHVGSQVTDLAALVEGAAALAALARELIVAGFPLRVIDIGGGLAVDYDASGAPRPEELAARVLPALEGLPLTLLLEPGRSLVAAAGMLLTRVLYVKESDARRFVIVDAGMNDLLRPALYEAFHRIEPVAERGREDVTVDVVGPVCESGDFLARGRALERVEPGELLAVRDAGAYAFSMASNYNLRPRAAEALVEAGQARLIRRRETFDDLMRTEL
jgi:diaminopimelate decarboxylase